ncbi:hypothetical protein CgunFtcFv8_000883 [Champsocephalus gunnari]|uniref:Cadherin domain-containing protein n=1 Tax=Champsocephalus gunnari TaxID=52237 RepID=A0AAN8DN46_CHAGU|nr:hypothetical protein CgunFtcFv8_000883 [Champsocephalus gunnari]
MEITRPRLFLILCLLVHSSSLKILKRQKRNWIIDSFTIREDHEGGFPYELGLLQVENKFSFSKIHGQGVEEEPKNILKINENTGMLTVHGPVDYEKFRVLKLTFQAYDQEKKEIDTQLGVEILIIDANDNPPIFEPDRYEVSIEESTPQGTELTTIKANDDDSTENNRLFDFKIISVIPDPFDLEFYLTQFKSTATVSFKGCLDHEKADAYIIKVEAKDRGEEVQLSSFATIIINIEDGNNHLPVITGQSGSGRVKEGEENVLVKRLQVTDRDTKGTSAWRAKYQIKEDENRNFKITTDPETNEGLLYVEKPLDYEESHEKHLNISVQNEAPYYSCKVERRSTTGLWKVNTIGNNTLTLSTTKVTVIVEDVNYPPIFDMTNKHVTVAENTKAGLYLATFAATDPDPDSSASTIVYTKGDDPADWVTVDPKTGNITTTKIIDRESHFVKDNTYKVTTYAADNGLPPMTGTATLNIHITDENDNVPRLTETTLDICQSDGLSQANITAFDLDQDPFGGPFSFKLQEKEKGKWKIDPTQGYTTKLVKERTVHSGEYDLVLKVSGFQGEEAVYDLSVIVCNCVDITKPNCRILKAKGSGVGGGALGIIFLSMLLLSAVLLLAFLLKCKTEHKPMPDNNDSGSGQLITNNIEKPGTDCNVELFYGHKDIKLPRRPSKRKPAWARHADQEINVMQHTMILKLLQDKLYALSAPEEELGDYDPHNYTEEGDEKHNFDLDAIFIPDIPFDPELDLDLDFRERDLSESENTSTRTRGGFNGA